MRRLSPLFQPPSSSPPNHPHPLLPPQSRANENERSSLIGRELEARKDAEVKLRETEVETEQKVTEIQRKIDSLENKVRL